MEFQQQGYADQLNIETPEQVDLRFPVAGIGSRFVAILLDHLFQFLAYFFFYSAFISSPKPSALKPPATPMMNSTPPESG